MEPKKTRKVRYDKGKKRTHYKKRATGIKRGPYKKHKIRTAEEQLETRIKISWNNFKREGQKLLNLNLIKKSDYDYYTNKYTGLENYRKDYLNQMNNPYVAVDGKSMSLQQKKNSRDNIRVNYVIRAGEIKIDKTTGKFLTREERILVPMHKFFLKNISVDNMFESQRNNYNKLMNASQNLKNYDLTNVDKNSELYQSISAFQSLSNALMNTPNVKGHIVVKLMLDSGFSREESIAEAHARGFNS